MRMKHKLSLAAFIILFVGLVTFITIPFSRLEQIHVFREDVIPEDKIGILLDRLVAYSHFIYIFKGLSFNEIPCNSNDGRKDTINIEFNWDNSISISENDNKITLNIDSIDFEPTLSYGDIPDFYNDDYYFESISFFDTLQMCDSLPSSIVLFRQKSTLLNGPHRYGFTLDINSHHLSTGDVYNGHIFEY